MSKFDDAVPWHLSDCEGALAFPPTYLGVVLVLPDIRKIDRAGYAVSYMYNRNTIQFAYQKAGPGNFVTWVRNDD